MPASSLVRRAVAEFLGTSLLLAAVVGSGIMGERLAGGIVGLALLANSVATGAALAALILGFGPISGAHFNPVVTIADASNGGTRWSAAPAYLAAQFLGAILGVCIANISFGQALAAWSQNARGGLTLVMSEFVATFGLVAVIRGCVQARSSAVPYAVAAYVSAAYWFTPSTSFANPAVTLARSLTDTFTGIRPADTPGFILAQLSGGVAATLLFRWLGPALDETKGGKDGSGPLRLSA